MKGIKYTAREKEKALKQWLVDGVDVYKVAKKFKCTIQSVYRWRRQYDGTLESLANKSSRPHRWRDFMGKKKKGRNLPTRFVVERVYSGTESMERALTSVSEEAARHNVEERLKEKKTA